MWRKYMKRIIVFGNLLIIVLFLCMPLIPAVHIASNESFHSSRQYVSLDYASEDVKIMTQIKHPILYNLVWAHIFFRIYRSGVFLSIHLKLNQKGVIAELANFRLQTLAYNTICYLLLWGMISDKLGWNWNII